MHVSELTEQFLNETDPYKKAKIYDQLTTKLAVIMHDTYVSPDKIKPITTEEQEFRTYVHEAKHALSKLQENGLISLRAQRRASSQLNAPLSTVNRELGRPFYKVNPVKDRKAQIQAADILKEQNIKDNETKLKVLNTERENVEKENRD